MSEVNGWMVCLEYNWSWLEIGMENQFVNIAVDVGTFLLVLICSDGFEWMSFLRKCAFDVLHNSGKLSPKNNRK